MSENNTGDLGRGRIGPKLAGGLCGDPQFEQKFQQLERLANMGTLSASMAHEIKNALVAVKTFTDLLLEKNQEAELASLVRSELARIDSIVSRMLRFAAPAPPGTAVIGLHEIIDHSLRLVQPHLERNSIALHRRLEAAADSVQGDDAQFQQAFLNLFFNALEAMRPGGTLAVTTQTVAVPVVPGTAREGADRSQIRVTIRDTGSGIAREHLSRLFEPFFTTKPHGTGLGLLITRRIILEHHGELSVQSQPGQGTTFEILLPAA